MLRRSGLLRGEVGLWVGRVTEGVFVGAVGRVVGAGVGVDLGVAVVVIVVGVRVVLDFDMLMGSLVFFEVPLSSDPHHQLDHNYQFSVHSAQSTYNY